MDRAAANSLAILADVPQVDNQITVSVQPEIIVWSNLAQSALLAMRETAWCIWAASSS